MDKGDVSVEIADAPTNKCRVITEVRGDSLVLEAERLDQRSSVACPAAFRVLMPERLDLRLASGSGDVEVSSMSGALWVRSGSGDIELRLCSGELTAKLGSGALKGEISSREVEAQSGSGAIELSGLRGSAKVQTGSGDMTLSWAEIPVSADVDLKSGSSDIRLLFPADARLKSSFHARGGAVSNEFGYYEGGAKVVAMTGSGGISLRKKLSKKK
jgi:DUF4097 and DUF4098 domain-containing protein YvlB